VSQKNDRSSKTDRFVAWGGFPQPPTIIKEEGDGFLDLPISLEELTVVLKQLTIDPVQT